MGPWAPHPKRKRLRGRPDLEHRRGAALHVYTSHILTAEKHKIRAELSVPWNQRLVASLKMYTVRMMPFHRSLRGPMRSMGSATDTQDAEGEKYEDTNDGHDGSPPSGGNRRFFSDRPSWICDNKFAHLSQKFSITIAARQHPFRTRSLFLVIGGVAALHPRLDACGIGSAALAYLGREGTGGRADL